MKRPVHRISRLACALLLAILAPCVTAQNEGGEKPKERDPNGVPFLKDIPVIGNHFKNHGVGYSKDGLPSELLRGTIVVDDGVAVTPNEDGGVGNAPMGTLERWALDNLKKRHATLKSVEVVDVLTARTTAAGTSAVRRRTIEITGPDADVHAAADYVAAMKAQSAGIVSFEFKIAELPGAADEKARETVTILDQSGIDAFVLHLQAFDKAEIVAAPRISAYFNQITNVSLTNEVAYVKDFKVERTDDTWVADPIVATVSEGIDISAAALRLPNGEGLTVRASVNVSSVTRPIAEFKTKVAGREVTVQLPEVTKSGWGTDEVVVDPKSAGFVIRGLTIAKDGKTPRAVVVICTIKAVAETESPAAAVVFAFDAAQSLAIARLDEKFTLTVGAAVVIGDGTTEHARGTVKDVSGRTAVIAVTSGTPKVGDRVK